MQIRSPTLKPTGCNSNPACNVDPTATATKLQLLISPHKFYLQPRPRSFIADAAELCFVAEGTQISMAMLTSSWVIVRMGIRPLRVVTCFSMVLARDCGASALLSSTSFFTHGGKPKPVVPHGGGGVGSNRSPRRTHGFFALLDLHLGLLVVESRHLIGGDGLEDVLLHGLSPTLQERVLGIWPICAVWGRGRGGGAGEGVLCVAVAHRAALCCCCTHAMQGLHGLMLPLLLYCTRLA